VFCQLTPELFIDSLYAELVLRLKEELIKSNIEEDLLACPKIAEEQNDKEPETPGTPDPIEKFTNNFILSTVDPNMLAAFGDFLDLGIEHAEEGFQYGIFDFAFK
jgi:hypothetical protein